MLVNSDFSKSVVIRPNETSWAASPQPGVERLMLDRLGAETGRATSIVRYAPGSSFSPHVHVGGEEFLVLEGTFSDEHGDYPAGTYVRNPIGSKHTPFSNEGCVIFVKLHQFKHADGQRIVVNSNQSAFRPGMVDGLEVLPLHDFGGEHVALVRWQPGTYFKRHTHAGGEEILVVEGVFEDEHGQYPKGTWLRNPTCSTHTPFSREGALIYIKVGHLAGLD